MRFFSARESNTHLRSFARNQAREASSTSNPRRAIRRHLWGETCEERAYLAADATIDALRQISINEIHYDPDQTWLPLEFIELHNRSNASIDVSGWQLVDGVNFTMPPGTQIQADGYLVVSQDPTEVQTKFGVTTLGPWQGRLDNDGERISLVTEAGWLIDRVDYQLGFPWPTVGEAPGPSIQLVNSASDNELGGNWRSAVPTPGAINGVVLSNPPPLIEHVKHEPTSPHAREPVTITANVADSDGVGTVRLQYQLVEPGRYIRLSDPEYSAPEQWTTVAMHDDGLAGDVAPGDAIFTVVLPAELQVHRRLVRYQIVANDGAGQSIQVPYADDPQPNFAYFTYDAIPSWTAADQPGVTPLVTYGADVMNSLPAYHLIANERDVINSQYVASFNGREMRATLIYHGQVYDHITFANRGQNSTYVTGKNKWKLHFKAGHEFEARDDYDRPWKLKVRKLNLGTAASPWARPNRGLTGMDEALAFKFFNLMGVPAPRTNAIQLRVIDQADEADPASQYNGDLWGFYLAYEDVGGRFLDEHDLPDGNLFRMQGGANELKTRGLGLIGNQSDLRAFTSTRTGYTKANPVQPESWWRENVDLATYYSYRAVIEALNHSDLRDQENSLEYYNATTHQWTQLPWDLDLLYEEFDRWGPDGVQTNSPLEKFRLALEHETLRIEFQSRLREAQDLLFNPDQAWQAVEEYARHVEPFAYVDRAMWNYHPRTSAAHKGYFFKSPAPYDGGAAGQVRRALTSPDFDGMVNWVKEFIVDGGFGGSQLKALHQDPQIPETPSIDYAGPVGHPVDQLTFHASPFHDPDGSDTWLAAEWRVAEVTDKAAPSYNPHEPVHFEITPTWDSGVLTTKADTQRIDPSRLQAGHAYRARVRFQDQTGRWSHWSEPASFIAGPTSSPVLAALRISEVHYHPGDLSDRERLLGIEDADQFEFIELVNISPASLDLRGVHLVRSLIGGIDQGVAFDFTTSAITELAPGARVVVVNDVDAFRVRYGNAVPVAGAWSGQLDNRSETLTLQVHGQTVQQFTYDDTWYRATDGRGRSLEVIDPTLADLAVWSLGTSWQASQVDHGTPGRAPAIPGDANHDGRFQADDLLQVFQLGKYEDNEPHNATWEEGDWNGDGEFDTADLVLVWQWGGFAEALGVTPKKIYQQA